eukprot:gene3778-13844_t
MDACEVVDPERVGLGDNALPLKSRSLHHLSLTNTCLSTSAHVQMDACEVVDPETVGLGDNMDMCEVVDPEAVGLGDNVGEVTLCSGSYPEMPALDAKASAAVWLFNYEDYMQDSEPPSEPPAVESAAPASPAYRQRPKRPSKPSPPLAMPPPKALKAPPPLLMKIFTPPPEVETPPQEKVNPPPDADAYSYPPTQPYRPEPIKGLPPPPPQDGFPPLAPGSQPELPQQFQFYIRSPLSRYVNYTSAYAFTCPRFRDAIFRVLLQAGMDPEYSFATNIYMNGCSDATERPYPNPVELVITAYFLVTPMEWNYLQSSVGLASGSFIAQTGVICGSTLTFESTETSPAYIVDATIQPSLSANKTPKQCAEDIQRL